MKLSAFKVNSAAIEGGRWISLDSYGCPGLRLRVRGSDNLQARALRQKLTLAIPLVERLNGLNPEQTERIAAQVLQETVLLEWDGLVDDSDQPIPYSREMADTLMTDADYRQFATWVGIAADLVAKDDALGVEADVKN